jgi:hypothetical protein
METNAEKEFPQCNQIAEEIMRQSVNKINAIRINEITDNTPYVRQCVMELLIAKLERLV